MSKSSIWKVGVILLSALVLGFFDLPASQQTKIFPATPEVITKMQTNLGLDLKGGSQLDYKIDLRKVAADQQESVKNGIVRAMEKRVNSLGVAEPNIYLSKVADEDHVVVELAGVDIEEAKATVGKTVQLEFKEPRTELDEVSKNKVYSQAKDFIARAQADSENFAKLAEEESNTYVGQVIFYKSGPYLFRNAVTDEYHPFIDKINPGEIVGETIDLDAFYDITDDGQLVQRQGTSVLKLLDRKTAEFEDFAMRYSNEPGAEESFGKLADPVTQEGSKYVQAFVDGAMKLNAPGEISAEPVESEFGYHIIKANDVRQENGKKVVDASHILIAYKGASGNPDTERPKEVAESFSKEIIERIKIKEYMYKIERVFFSTAPDPWKETALTGKQFKTAGVSLNPQTQEIAINISFDDEGAQLFEELTARNIGQQIAIFVGGNMISSPTVNTKITGGDAIITGYNSLDAAHQLAEDLNTGAIGAPITLTGQYTISASLGHEALQTSLKAGLIGLLILGLFMIIYYRALGVVATIALTLYTTTILFLIKVALPVPAAIAISVVLFIVLLYKIVNSDDSGWEKLVSFIVATAVLFLFSIILSTPITLTLAGVAGVILSIGIAVDANVLIFERMKEEFRDGRSLASSIETGFQRAWTSIRDSNFSTLITCVILIWFGSSLIKGFAFNLAMGVLVSMFSAITITKTLIKTFIGTKIGKSEFLFCANSKKKLKPFSFIKTRRFWYAVSSIMILVTFFVATSFGLRLGRDFTGGALLSLKMEKPATSEEITNILEETEQKINGQRGAESEEIAITAQVSDFGAPNIVKSGDEYIIRIKHITEEQHQAILASLGEKFGKIEETRFSTIGPVIGDSLKEKASWALAIAAIMIVLYVAFAFRHVPKSINPWRFGITTIIAVIHDLIIVMGLYLITARFVPIEIDALFITAMLTILGYSVNDTIVVFDRIRENIKRMSKSSFDDVLDASLNQTIARSINTSLSTLIPLTALFLLGGESIRWFVLTLMFGAIVGTYSSIFIASALLSSWKKFAERK